MKELDSKSILDTYTGAIDGAKSFQELLDAWDDLINWYLYLPHVIGENRYKGGNLFQKLWRMIVNLE